MTPERSVLRLNAFRVEFDVTDFTVWARPRTADLDLRAERAAHAGVWKIFAEGAQLLTLRCNQSAPEPSGTIEKRAVDKSFSLLKWLVDDAFPSTFPAYRPIRLHPFSFVGTQRDLVAEVASELRIAGDVLDGFTIRPRYEVSTRVVSLRGAEPFIAAFVAVRTRWEVIRELADLAAAGVDLSGLYAVRRHTSPGERRLVGRIEGVDGPTVRLSDTFEGPADVLASEVQLEGSRQSFARCLPVLLGSRHEHFEGLRIRRERAWLAPTAVDQEFDRMGGFLGRCPLKLADGLQARVMGRVEVPKRGRPPNVTFARPVLYCFDAARTKQDRSAWSGLSRFGPFSRDTFPRKSPRILVVFPDVLKGRTETFLRALRDGVTGAPASGFGAGLAKTFGLIDPTFPVLAVSWSGPARPAGRYRTAIEDRLAVPGESFDAAIVVLRDEDARLPDHENPYLHSKALLLVAGIPTQEVRQSTIADTRGLPYTLRNIATALYAKLGGSPWTVDQDFTISDEVVIGVGVCEVGESRFAERQRYVGVTTVFRGDGNYLLAHLSRECSFNEYPEVLRTSTMQVLRDVKQRNAWQPGETVRVVCHAHRPLRDIDTARIMADCVRVVGEDQTVEFAFVTVSRDHPFRVVDPGQQGLQQSKGRLVPERGTVVNIGPRARLLCVTGPSLLKFDPAPLPDPLLVTLHRASTFRDLDYLTEQVLKFTALSWRSILPASQPVTILYSELIAELLARLRVVRDWSTLPLSTTLRASRWFL